MKRSARGGRSPQLSSILPVLGTPSSSSCLLAECKPPLQVDTATLDVYVET